MYLSRLTRSSQKIAASSFSSSFLAAVAMALPVATTVSLSMLATPALAQSTPVCSSAAADQDGDGWGWENYASCVVSAPGGSARTTTSTSSSAGLTAAATDPSLARFPSCSGNISDTDGDGWGWDNNASCIFRGGSQVAQTTQTQSTQVDSATGVAVCQSSASDSDNDGWGYENGASCVVTASSGSAASTSLPTVATAVDSATGVAVCQSSASDLDNDGWGFENGVSCVVTSASGSASSSTSVVTPGVAPPPVAAAVAGFQNGNPICLTDASDAGNNGFGYENNRTCVVVQGVTATRNQPLLNQRSCIPWLEIGYGNYKLQNNTWNDGAVYSDNWSQCIELTGSPGNYVAKWDYNWLDRNQGDDFAVKSYPQVYIGRKTQYNLSGSVAETGMPVRIDSMPTFYVDYDYSETGTVERNVALESFFHNSCEAEEYNKQFELMVWVGRPTIRTPGTLVATATLSGREWDVYTNPALGWSYVAFVAKQPHNVGSLNWNEFVYWSRDVGPSYGVPYMNPNGCMGAIEIGTETFWGTGTFTLNNFNVRR